MQRRNVYGGLRQITQLPVLDLAWSGGTCAATSELLAE